MSWFSQKRYTLFCNYTSTIAALTGLSGKHVLIAGGVSKGADFSVLRDVVAEHCRAVILFGQDAEKIKSALSDSVKIADVIIDVVKDMKVAVTQAQSLAQKGDNVLLSPACASFDMFDNFEHRGEVFIQLVEALES